VDTLRTSQSGREVPFNDRILPVVTHVYGYEVVQKVLVLECRQKDVANGRFVLHEETDWSKARERSSHAEQHAKIIPA
jgi:hypothetical protein